VWVVRHLHVARAWLSPKQIDKVLSVFKCLSSLRPSNVSQLKTRTRKVEDLESCPLFWKARDSGQNLET
jgi:hypothetical protein